MNTVTRDTLTDTIRSLLSAVTPALTEKEAEPLERFSRRVISDLASVISGNTSSAELLLLRFTVRDDTTIDVVLDLPRLSFLQSMGRTRPGDLRELGAIRAAYLKNSFPPPSFPDNLRLEEEIREQNATLISQAFSDGVFSFSGFYALKDRARLKLLARDSSPAMDHLQYLSLCRILKNGICPDPDVSRVPAHIHLRQVLNPLLHPKWDSFQDTSIRLLPCLSFGPDESYFVVWRHCSFACTHPSRFRLPSSSRRLSDLKQDEITRIPMPDNRHDGIKMYKYILDCKDVTIRKILCRLYIQLVR